MKSFFLILLLMYSLFNLNAQNKTLFKDGDTVCFLGDSITHGGWYLAFICDYYVTRYPNKKLNIYNCGIAGDSARGAVQRLDWDVLVKSPNKVAIMFGMNDVRRVLYGRDKNDAANLARRKKALEHHKNNMKKIMDILKGKNIEIILLTPTPYDQEVNVKAKNLKGTNDALAFCAKFCKDQAEKYNATLIDFHGPLTALNRKMQKNDPTSSLVGQDRVHPHLVGHQVMAYLFLKNQGAPPEVATIEIDFPVKQVTKEQNCSISNLKFNSTSIGFNYLAKALPYPMSKEYKKALESIPLTAELNREIIQVKGLPKGSYKLTIDGKKVCNVKADQLEHGFNIATLATPQQKQAQNIHKFIMARRAYEYKQRNIAKLEITMRGKKIDPNNKKARAEFLVDFAEEIQKSPYKKYYLRLIAGYRKDKAQDAQIADKIQILTKRINKANKPKSYLIRIAK